MRKTLFMNLLPLVGMLAVIAFFVVNQDTTVYGGAPVGTFAVSDNINPTPPPAPAAPVAPVVIPAPVWSCVHVWEWQLVEPATASSEGLLAEKCTSCGAIGTYSSTGSVGGGAYSAYTMFSAEVIEQFETVEADATVTFETELWVSLPQRVMEAIAARRDVQFELIYRLEGRDYRIVIPAGAEVPTDVPFAGFDGYLAGLYGKEEIIRE